MYRIYIVRNTVNGKIYIGMTSQTIHKRWKNHVHLSRHVSPKQYVTRAIKKHGETSFTIKQIDQCDTRQLACLLEMAYICMYQATNPELGYNNTHGGDGVIPTPEVRAKIGAAHRGVHRPHTEEAKRKISDALRGVPKPPGFGAKVSAGKRGKKVSAEICRALSASRKGKPALNKRTDAPDEDIARMYKNGDTLAAIARHFSLSDQSVGRRLSNMGLIEGKYQKKKEIKWWMQTS